MRCLVVWFYPKKGYEAERYWSSRFIKELEAIDCGGGVEPPWVCTYPRLPSKLKRLYLEATRAIRKLCRNSRIKDITL